MSDQLEIPFAKSREAPPKPRPPHDNPVDKPVTVVDARAFIETRLDDGVHCPCCDKWMRRYSRTMNRSMLRSLAWLSACQTKQLNSGKKVVGFDWVKLEEYSWVDVPKKAPRWLLRTNQLATLRWWGLIERKKNEDEKRKHNGLWRPTDDGISFLSNQLAVPEKAITYNGELVKLTGEEIYAKAVAKDFNYAEIMGSSSFEDSFPDKEVKSAD